MTVLDYDDGSRIIQNVYVCHQGKTKYCSQACITSILTYWGYNVRYEDIIAETNSLSGMSPEQIVWYFRKYNFQSRAYKGTFSDLKRLIDKGLPTIVGFDENTAQHVVVVVGYNDHREVVFYNDSMYGELTEEPYSDFLRAWSKKRANSSGMIDNSLSNLLIQVNR